MCNDCKPFNIDFQAEAEAYQDKLGELERMISVIPKMTNKDKTFAESLANSFAQMHSLSPRQWEWVTKLADRVTALEPIYGDFKAIRVAFRIAGEKMKFPKIRLLSDGDRFVQLNFKPDSDQVDVYVDGWQGHGYRKFAGWIEDGQIKPYSADRMTDDVKNVIQSLAMDPMGVAKAMSNRLGACIFCMKRLSDSESKRRGYGKTCAANYGLEWGKDAA